MPDGDNSELAKRNHLRYDTVRVFTKGGRKEKVP